MFREELLGVKSYGRLIQRRDLLQWPLQMLLFVHEKYSRRCGVTLIPHISRLSSCKIAGLHKCMDDLVEDLYCDSKRSIVIELKFVEETVGVIANVCRK